YREDRGTPAQGVRRGGDAVAASCVTTARGDDDRSRGCFQKRLVHCVVSPLTSCRNRFVMKTSSKVTDRQRGRKVERACVGAGEFHRCDRSECRGELGRRGRQGRRRWRRGGGFG